ncbi:MAG: hypothetical protein WKF30_02700 [Pyrinomonadaceae bacterium]
MIADLPGRASVAFGAGLAEAGHLVTTFDNFPHPLGVTPSHETLAAMLYYAGEVEAKQQNLPAQAPAVFLLDSQRLAPYKDADAQFDNRYAAKIPSAQKLQELGIKSVVYVTPDRTRAEELDDLNDDFVEYKNSGINVAMLPLADLTTADARAGGGGGGSFDNNGSGQGQYHYGEAHGSHVVVLRLPVLSAVSVVRGSLPGLCAWRRASRFAAALCPGASTDDVFRHTHRKAHRRRRRAQQAERFRARDCARLVCGRRGGHARRPFRLLLAEPVRFVRTRRFHQRLMNRSLKSNEAAKIGRPFVSA